MIGIVLASEIGLERRKESRIFACAHQRGPIDTWHSNEKEITSTSGAVGCSCLASSREDGNTCLLLVIIKAD